MREATKREGFALLFISAWVAATALRAHFAIHVDNWPFWIIGLIVGFFFAAGAGWQACKLHTARKARQARSEAILAAAGDEEWLKAVYGKTSEELADEAEQGYDPARFVPYQRPEKP